MVTKRNSQGTSPSSSRITTPEAAALIAVTLLACILRFARLGAEPLWLDESYTFLAASAIHTDGPLAVKSVDYISPGNYFLAAIVTRIGSMDAAWLRAPSAFCGCFSVPLVWYLARKMVNSRAVAVISAALMALSPFAVWYSQEARAYMPLVLISSAYMLTSWEAWCSGINWRRALQLTLLGALGLWFHMAMLYLFCATGLLALYAWRLRRPFWAWLTAHAFAIALYLPWVMITWRDLSTGITVNSGSYLLRLPYNAFITLFGPSLGPTPAEVGTSGPLASARMHAPVMTSAVLAMCIFAAGMVRALGRVHHQAVVFLAAWVVIPNATLLAGSWITHSIYNARYAITTLPGIFIVAAVTMRFSPHRRLVGIATALATLLWMMSLGNLLQGTRYGKEDLRGAAAALRREPGPADMVVIANWNAVPPLKVYGFDCTTRTLALRGPEGLATVSAVKGSGLTYLVENRQWEVVPSNDLESAFQRRHGLPLSRRSWNGATLTIWKGTPGIADDSAVLPACRTRP